VDIPTSLAGIQFAFADGALSIRCSGFSGDIVLSRREYPIPLPVGCVKCRCC
jgi:hypothetical protein